MSSAVFAQSTTQGSATSLEDLPIRASVQAKTSPTTQGAVRADATRGGGLVDMPRVGMALAIVLALIFALRVLGRRYFPNITGSKSAGAVRVLSRNPVSPKQQVLLLQVGRRVIVVGDNGTQMSPLSEITDPDEVAHLIGQVTGPNSSGAFAGEFGKAAETYDKAELEDEAEAAPRDLGLSEVARRELAASPAEPGSESIESAHGEINGLMEKVRGLARQLGR